MAEESPPIEPHVKTLRAECNLYAKEQADKARNQALGIFAFIALIASLLVTVGVYGLARDYIDDAFESALEETSTKKLLREIHVAHTNAKTTASLMEKNLESATNTNQEIVIVLEQLRSPATRLEVGGDIIAAQNRWGPELEKVNYGYGAHI